MKSKIFRKLLILCTVIFSLSACTLPGFSTPTPFSFPTPDQTMTALFEPTQEAPATSAPEDTDVPQATAIPTDSPDEPTATDEPEPTATDKAVDPTATTKPTESYVGPIKRDGPTVSADYLKSPPTIDGDLYDWDAPIQRVINYVVYGADKHSGELDSSGTVVLGWDEDYLYIGFRVKDDKYVQEASGKNLYKGDSVEILFDAVVAGDYYYQGMSLDDFQIGVSPGKGGIAVINGAGKLAVASATGSSPENYVWYPSGKSGSTSKIKMGVLEGGQGYQVELAISWKFLGVDPYSGAHYGFALSISDNDKPGTTNQQTMVSNVSTRYFADPTTWGDLYLKPK